MCGCWWERGKLGGSVDSMELGRGGPCVGLGTVLGFCLGVGVIVCGARELWGVAHQHVEGF